MAERVKCLQCRRPRFYPWVGKIPWRRKWQPTPVLLPGKSHGWRSLVGYNPWGHKESDTTERLLFHFSLSCIGEGNGNPLQYSCLENLRDGGAQWAAFYGVTQSRTGLKRLSSSSSSFYNLPPPTRNHLNFMVYFSLSLSFFFFFCISTQQMQIVGRQNLHSFSQIKQWVISEKTCGQETIKACPSTKSDNKLARIVRTKFIFWEKNQGFTAIK